MKAAPIILLVDDEQGVLDALEHALLPRYAPQYRLARATSSAGALAALEQCKRDSETVALCLADLWLPDAQGIEWLITARAAWPEMRCVLLAPYEDAEEAVRRVNTVGIDRYLVKPWGLPHETLYPAMDELLDDWLAAVRLPYMRVRAIMDTRIARIRDDANLHLAAEIVALSGVGDLMVVDGRGNFVGVLSEGDILRNALPDFDDVLEAGGTLYEAYQLFLRKGRELSSTPISALVIREPLVIHPDDHVAKAATVLIHKQIRRLPVVEHGRLVGTVSRANICQAVVGDWVE